MKSARIFCFSFAKFVLALLVLGFLSVYFRTYALHGGPSRVFRSSESLAQEVVERGMKEQMQAAIEKNYPGIPPYEKGKLVELQIQRLRTEDRDRYKEVVKNTSASIDRVRKGEGFRYLLEADPYYFLRRTEDLLETKNPPELRKDGKYLDLFMRAPHGNWSVLLLHPNVGFYWYKLIRFFYPGASLMTAVGYLPLFLTVLILPLYAGLGRVLRLPFFASVIGMTTIALSPIFIQRSALGWYDTDPYNYIFPILILSFVFQGLKNRKWFWAGALGASVLTGLYALFWPGWIFIGILVPGSIGGGIVALEVLGKFKRTELSRTAVRFLMFYVIGSLVFLAFFMTPGGLLGSLRMGWSLLNKFGLANFDIWPNIFLTVGEAGSITVRKLIFLTGNYVTFAIAGIGLFWEGIHAVRRQNLMDRFRFFFFLFFGAPIFLMSLKTERFSVLFVLPLAIFAGFAVARFVEWAQGALPGILPKVSKQARCVRAAALLCVWVLYTPMLLLSAHVVATGIKPIMDDVWYSGLSELRAKTPEDSIVNSWWPPGHFITGVAHRRVVLDGGTQEFHASYWMAKALMAEDEREASGILRMLDASGEDAPDLLERLGMDVPDTVDLILKIVRLNRAEALRVLPSFLNAQQKEDVLDKTHGRGALPPSYVLVYNDLVEQNLAVSVVANWDFRKAESIRGQKTKGGKGASGLFQRDAGKRYVQDLMQASGKWLKYTPLASLAKGEGGILFFTNGLRVDVAAKEAMIVIPSKGVQGTPASLFFPEQGRLVEKILSAGSPDVSALIFEENGAFYSVLADARLIRSLLFRLYYLNGEGLMFFKPVLSRGTLRGGTVVRVFKLDTEKFSA